MKNFFRSIALSAALVPVLLGAQVARAESEPSKIAYYVAEFTLIDAEGIRPYSQRVESTFKPYSGRYIVRGGPIASLEGDAVSGRIVVIAFDSVELAKAWYASPEYQAIRPIREKSATSRVYIVEGIPR